MYKKSDGEKPENKPATTIDETDDITHVVSLGAVDSKYSWLVVFCSFFCNLIVDGMQYTFSNIFEPILNTFNSTTTAVSLIGSLLSGFYNFSGPLAGALANKFGFRMVTITGSLVSALGLGVSYFAPSVEILYFTYGVIGGLGFGMVYMSSVITTSLYFDKYRALATSISVCGTGIGTFVFSPFGNWLVSCYGWRVALAVEAGIVLLCILFGLAFKPIDVVSLGPLVEDYEMQGTTSATTIRTIRTLRESIVTTTEAPSRAYPNQAYPTLKQALTTNPVQDDDGRRSLYSKSARPSTIFSVRASFVIQSQSDSNEEFVNTTRYEKQRRSCKRKFRKFCYNCWHCRCQEKKQLTIGDRPMYRDDIFYEGSLAPLRNYSKGDPIDYHLSVIRVPHERDAQEHKRQKICGCHEAMIRTVITMLGLNLLKNCTFIFLCISSFLYTMGVFIPYIFIRALAEQSNVEMEKSIWLVSTIGVANTLGRLFSGALMSCGQVNAAILVFFCTITSSLVCFMVLLPIMVDTIFIFASAFGFFTAPFVSLRPVVIVEFLGLEKLTNAFGLVLLTQGVASIIGPPLAGIINEVTGQIAYTIIFAGGLLLVSALSILVSTILVKKQQKS